MGKGYMSNISFYSDPIEIAVQELEAQLVAGVTAGAVLDPMIEELGKKIQRYNQGMKQVKTVYAARLTWGV